MRNMGEGGIVILNNDVMEPFETRHVPSEKWSVIFASIGRPGKDGGQVANFYDHDRF